MIQLIAYFRVYYNLMPFILNTLLLYPYIGLIARVIIEYFEPYILQDSI